VGKLLDFVNSLADDPDKEALFEAEPIAVMTKDDIDEADQRLILEGTAHDVRARLQEELGDERAVIFRIIMSPTP
jgi:hypothetical protein